MSIVENFKDVVTNHFADFKGRDRRSTFWYFYLMVFAISVAFNILGEVAGIFAAVGSLVGLVLLIPQLAAGTRRLHDTGKSGWWQLVALTGIGILLLFFFWAQDSEPGTNQYGPNPKTGLSEADGITRHLVD